MELQTVAFNGQPLDAFLSESPQQSPISTHSQYSLASDLSFFSSADPYLYGPLMVGTPPSSYHPQRPFCSSADAYPYGWLPPEPPWLDAAAMLDEEVLVERWCPAAMDGQVGWPTEKEKPGRALLSSQPLKSSMRFIQRSYRDWCTSKPKAKA
ncbi:hypothetical protein FRB95_007989 [Tulasnella sp. JGI-2019a]|nr:hypothetical protein FRB93_004016 [Tulasnella sp. JGI-2019a]KAG9027202.1 hypothetical protein FRB95_007989 [Tulasnella sp. JGI-2019a]